MARVKKNNDPWHRLSILTDRAEGEVIVVKGGRRCYLWAGRTAGNGACVTVSGRGTLRRLANEILAELGK